MNYKVLEPEVAGGMGEQTVMDLSVHPPRVERLHYEFGGWLGDELLETFPCYIVSSRVADRLRASDLTGFTLDEAIVTISDEGEQLLDLENIELPDFEWLRVTGKAGRDDFGLITPVRLVVSDRALALLRTATLEHCEMEPFAEPMT